LNGAPSILKIGPRNTIAKFTGRPTRNIKLTGFIGFIFKNKETNITGQNNKIIDAV
jgi:hypothetical protein